jgi:photosynthetic reaction center H subunit
MGSGAITANIDVAQVVLYAFWIFFIALIIYLRREDKREGYPLESERSANISVQGFPRIPAPKTFRLANGTVRQVPALEPAERELHARPIANWPGAPLVPTGDPLRDGVGPAAYVARPNVPDTVHEGGPRIVPLRNAPEFKLEPRDPDLRGMVVVGADGVAAGRVTDLWVDRAEPQIRYLEMAVDADAGRAALIPITLVNIDRARRRIRVNAIRAAQFAGAPMLASPNEITLREEDRVSAYYAGGFLYAEPGRAEPLL